MRDTEPFTTLRVQVHALALPVQPAAHITLHWSPKIKSVQSCANMDESDVATSTHFFSSHTGQGGTESLSNLPMARPESSVWLTDSKPTAQATRHEVPYGISAESSLTPIGTVFVLVKQRVTWQAGKYPVRKATPSFSPTHESALKLSPEACSGPVVRLTTQVSPTVEFMWSGASSFLFWTRVLVEHGNTVVVTQMGNCQPVSV